MSLEYAKIFNLSVDFINGEPPGGLGATGATGPVGATGATGGGSSLYPKSNTIPLTSFNFYNRWPDNALEWWFQTSSLNNTNPVNGTNGQDMGTVNIDLAAGTWRITVSVYCDNTYGGIINFICNGVTTSVDSKSSEPVIAYTWTQTIPSDGTYTFQIINGGSSGSYYNMSFANQFISLFKL